MLTEADILRQSTSASGDSFRDSSLHSLESQILQQQQNQESLRLSRDSQLGVTKTITPSVDPLDLPPSTSNAAYDAKIWPKAPEPPNTEPGVDTGVTDER